MLTLADLGVLREVRVEPADGGHRVSVSITPTYSGCPAMDAMRDDLRAALRGAGFEDVRINVVLRPAWTTDWVSEDGRRKLAEAGIAPPGPAPARRQRAGGPAGPGGPVPLTLTPPRRRVRCPRCGSEDTELTSEFGSTACKALHRCAACREPFEHVKEI
jgi:ring-1,2-phenylacetyl-CoA epoxidase subunit PaaD